MAQRHVRVRGAGQRTLEREGRRGRRRDRESALALTFLISAAFVACQSHGPGGGGGASTETRASAISSAASAAQVLAAAQAQPGSPVAPAVTQGFTATAGGLTPQFSAASLAGEPRPATVALPKLGSGAMQLQDTTSGATVDVTLDGAAPVAAQTTGGYVVYPAALAGASVLHRALPSGSEDLLYLPARPAVAEVDYTISLGFGIAGLRLVGGVVEFLDSGGAPRLHVSPPYIAGADGARTDGALALAGCAADTDPSPPWGRAVTAPGASTCTVRVTWPDASVSYPAVLDPRWTTTGSMATARFEHTLVLLSTGKALAAGGRSTTSGTTGLTSCELYDPSTASWAATGSLAHGRRLHSATQLPTSSNQTTSGKVLVAGGISGSTSISTFELYSPSAGTWGTAGNMDTARHGHTATLLADGRVLAAGGLNGTTTLATAALYNPASGAGSWVATTGPIPPPGLKNQTATLIQTTNNQLNNHVLLVGGNNGTSTISAVYLFDPVQNAFSTLASISSPREQATALTLPNTNGKILVTGGKNGASVLNTAISFDPSFSNGTWSSAGTMTSARVGQTMTLLPNSIVANGQILVAGGSSTGSNFLSSAELFSGTSTWTATPSMPGALEGHQAVLLSGNSVLVAGGLSASSTVQTAAYLYDASFGLGCSTNGQCASGFCVSGVCCDSACTGTCGACNLAGHLGACTALGSGTVCRAAAGACDVAETCNGSSTSCPADGLAASGTTCRASAGECDPAETCSGTSAACPSDTKAASGTACTDDGNPCTQDQCDGSAVTCQHPVGNAGAVCRPAAGECDVAETCTGTSATCPADGFETASTVCRPSAGACDVAESCTGNSAACPADGFLPATTVCRVASGACDVAESCTGSSATCPADGKVADGTTCSDGDACTQTDTCQAGTCVGGNPVICVALDQCHTAGACSPSTGTCSNPAKANGTNCNDGNACTQADTCQAGSCTGGNPVTCTAQDQCHSAGSCDPANGTCSNPTLANGTTCNDGNACTQTDTCQAGSCTGGNPVTCTALDQCHNAGTCDPANGTCSNPVVANGTTCDDGNACTQTDTCQAGTCSGGNPVTCTAQDQCHNAGTCDPANGTCSNPNKIDGTTCDDGNACTMADACNGGSCSGTAVTCTALDQCHNVGTCSPSTGACSNPNKADGSGCDDGNSCTTGDSCAAGVCLSGASTCTALSAVQTFAGFYTVPSFDTGNAFSANPPNVVPGDPITFTVIATNSSTFMRASADMDVTNDGTTPFVWGSFQVTLDYQSATTSEWIPVAKASFDASGAQTDDPPLLHLNFGNPQQGFLAGLTIAPGQNVTVDSTENVTLPADIVNQLGDPAEVSQVRVEIHIDTGPETPGLTSDRDITASFRDGAATAQNVNGSVYLGGPDAATSTNLTPDVTSIPPGASVTLTGTAIASLLAVKQPGESDFQYFRRLQVSNAYTALLNLNVYFTGSFRIYPGLFAPILTVQKSGPSQGNAGFTLAYPVQLQNVGAAAAGPVAITDLVNGTDVGAQITIPPSIAAGTTGTAIINAATSIGQAAGPYTDQASVTWQDHNGNVYGPLSSAFTTSILAGHPEGYLTLATSTVTPAQILGTSVTLTATALDGLGNPMVGLPVQLTIAGSNAQTVPLVTGTDGTASFTYDGPNLGADTVTVTATINGPALTATVPAITWSTEVGTPCTGRSTPLDVMLNIDGSPSMFDADTYAAAQAAADTFIGDLNLTIDQIGTVTFSGTAELDVPFTTDATAAISGTNTALLDWAYACAGFCAGGTNYPDAFRVALAEFQGPRHRDSAQRVMVFISDGGNTGGDFSAQLAALKAAGVRIIVIALGANVDVSTLQQVASSPNDYFYAPNVSELAWAFGNVAQDSCSTTPPLVSAGGNQGLYDVRLPDSLTLQGEAHGSGPRGDLQLTSLWTEVSGPAPVTFTDASSPVTQVLFTDPGTYILQLEVSDGFVTTASRATITVDPAQTLQGANLAVALSAPGPLVVETPEMMTATLTDASSQPISNFVVQFLVTGANPGTSTATTNAAGVATFAYTGSVPGTDVLQATAIGGTATLASSALSLSWTPAAPGSNGIVSQGWIGAPAQRARVTGLVPVTVAAGVTIASSTVSVWSVKTPGNVITLATNAAGGPGATLATLDTTELPNGSYIIDVVGSDDHGNQQDNEILVAVAGDYKPGRLVVDVPEFTVPVAGIPIAIGRHYDTLDKDKVQDFGNGWSLTMAHPDLEVDQANDVTITLPNGRRSTFIFELQPVAVGPIVLGFIAQPLFVPEPGVFGSLTADGCSVLVFDPTSANIAPTCFDSIFDPTQTQYAPTTYKYTDAYGTAYTMGIDGTLKTIQDRNNNIITFTPNGIVATTGGAVVSITRDTQGRITKILTPDMGDYFHSRFEYDYAYDAAGNLLSATDPGQNVYSQITQYTYDESHRLLTTKDASGHFARTSTFDAAGRLATDTDAMGNATSYAYDVPGHTTTTTYPDTGVLAQTFDDNGMLLSQTDQLGRITTHQYDANRNEIKRTNALGEVTTYTYDANGNQTSSTNTLHETTTTTYNAFSEPLTTTNPIGNTTTIVYDDAGLPTSFTDSMGPLATFTSSEHGLPLTVTDAVGNAVYLNYNAAGDLTARLDRLGRSTSYQYDAMGRKTSMIDPRGNITSYSYDNDGDLLLTTFPGSALYSGFGPLIHLDANRNVQDITTAGLYYGVVQVGARTDHYMYDADNHLTTTTHGNDATEIDQTVDFRGNVLTRTDEIGHATGYTYDLAGQLVQTTNADGTFTMQAFDALGRLATKTDERNNTTTYTYEPGCGCAERLTSVTDPLGRTTSMTYDGMGRKTSMTDANGHPTSYAYDLRGHLIETDYADGTATHDTYDTLGRRTASADQTGATTQYGYDAEGQLTSVKDPLGNVTQYGYDPNGNLTSVTDANNHTTTYAYDPTNRKISRTLPLGMTETFAYDNDNNVTTHTDFRGKTATYAFDDRRPGGRLTSKVPDPTLGEPTVMYGYNVNSTRSSMTDASGATSYTYDPRNRLLTKATPEGTLTYTYDASGNVASIDSSNANGTSVAYAWDEANQLSTVTDNRLGGMTTAAYTGTGRPASLAQPNGVGVTYGYDSLDRVTSMAWQKGTNPAFASWAYGYNQRGQRTSSTDVTAREAAYGYDAASRLTSETITGDPSGPTGNGSLTYGLDAAGNRLSRASTLAALDAQSFSYDGNDELTTDTYDLNGNTTSSGGHTYGYDFENRLVSKDGSAITLVYDGDGNRVAKTVGGVMTQYLVDELNPTGYLQVMDEVADSAVQVRYTYGNMLVSQTRSPSTSPVASFYGYDAHGNIAFLTDSTGNVIDTYTYDAWGNLVGRTGSTLNTRLFVGEEFDSDLGLINLRARQYRPAVGRFLTTDPAGGHYGSTSTAQQQSQTADAIASAITAVFANENDYRLLLEVSAVSPSSGQTLREPLGLNPYLFANADPVSHVDPTGLADAIEEGVDEASVPAQTIKVVEEVGKNPGCEIEFLVKVLSCSARYGGNQISFELCVASAARAYAVCRGTGLPN